MNTTYFKAGSELTFNTVMSIRASVCKTLKTDRHEEFCLDLTKVVHCDSAGLALLIEIKQLCKQYNKAFRVLGVPANTQSLAEFCGVKDILETIQTV